VIFVARPTIHPSKFLQEMGATGNYARLRKFTIPATNMFFEKAGYQHHSKLFKIPSFLHYNWKTMI